MKLYITSLIRKWCLGLNISVYIDTCVVRETYKGTINDKDFQALTELTEIDFITFIVSDVMKEELGQIKDDKQRASLAVLYKIFRKCKRYATEYSVMPGAYSRTPYGRRSSAHDPLYISVKKIFTQKDKDPEHIFQAIKNECDYYLTVDYKTILKKAETHEEELTSLFPNIKFVSPSSLLTVLMQKENED